MNATDSDPAPSPAGDDCTCAPCTTPQHGVIGWAHCAACCAGSLIVDYDPRCPITEHRRWAALQHPEPGRKTA